MKKKIISGMAVLVIATVVAFNANLGSKANSLSELSMMNMEALAQPVALEVAGDDKGGTEQICCNKAFSSEECVKINNSPVKGRRHPCE